MRDQWYGDKRDLVKWGTIIHLAKKHDIRNVIQVAYYRPSEIPQLEHDGETFDMPPEVWHHCRSITDIGRLRSTSGVAIDVFDSPFSHQTRSAYQQRVLSKIQECTNQKIVFLDPDTGIEPAHANHEHVKRAEIAAIWEAMLPNDILVMYQHRQLFHGGWLASTRGAFLSALGISECRTFNAPAIVNDVAFFVAMKHEDHQQPT